MGSDWLADLSHVLITEEQLQARVRELGATIATDYIGKHPVLVCVLKGSLVFLADLMRALPMPVQVEALCVSSYGRNDRPAEQLEIRLDLDTDICDRDVLIIEDIIDTGRTLSRLLERLAERRPASLAICAMFDKSERREVEVPVRYVGFQIPNEFVVGYGLDYAERYRNLPYVAVVRPEAYSRS
jgi:hypoxanthine phosphoribosyltransferase